MSGNMPANPPRYDAFSMKLHWITAFSVIFVFASAQEKRHGMNLVWWHHAGYQYVLIGRNPTDQLKNAAMVMSRVLAV